MRRLLNFIRQSFSARLSLWVVLFAAMVFLAAQIYVSVVARRLVRAEAVKGASQVMENTTLRLNNIIEDVEIAADNLEWLVYRNLDSPQRLMEYSRSTVQGNSFLLGCSVSLEPFFFKGEKYFSAYSYNNGETVVSVQEGADDYQYFYMDWYLLPKLLRQPCWTEPYNDWESDDSLSMDTERTISYCKPLTDKDGNFLGSISLDISLEWLTSQIAPVKPYKRSYSVLISRGGTYLVHPDPDKLFYHTVFTEALEGDDPELEELGHSMLEWNEGSKVLEIEGERCLVFYKPIKSTGWSAAIVCPEKEIFGGFNRLLKMALLISALGLLLMFLTCFRVVSKTMRPLSALAGQARNIAEGNFKVVLPKSDRQDEIGVLSNSFENMRSSLVSYIDELTRTTAANTRIEGELQIARGIQKGMLPSIFPPFPDRKDVDLYASMTPAKEVGGDLYDFFIEKGSLYFCIGDVSGKGVPASLIMAVTRNLFRVMGQQGLPPDEIAGRLNEILCQGNDQMMFVTMFIGRVNLETGLMDFCNCGHNPPVTVSRDGKVAFLESLPNTPLGVQPGFWFEEEIIDDVGGMTLFLYTDGLNEAENKDFEQFGNDRLLSVINSNPSLDAEAMVKEMSKAVAGHVKKAEPSDDLAMLCLKIASS
ncbi:MAG: SpoIIE family protein phosphatase [Bacteroidales bacterium]|nr:SpoIIE family protein phosphatase [Bacteroidales bacterium]